MNLTYYGAYTDGKEFWFPSKEMNALYYMNSSDGNVEYKGSFPKCFNNNAWNIKRVIEYHDELFFFSIHAYQVWKLNKKTNEIKEYTYCNHPVSRIINIENIQDKVWVIPSSFNSPIVFFDLQEEKGHLFQWNSKTYVNYGTNSFTRATKSGDKLYFATRNKDDIHLCILDCGQKTILFENLNTLSLVQCIGIDENKLWVFGENKQKRNVLQEYDINTLKQRKSYELVLPEKLMEKGGLSYFLMFVSGKRIFLIPAWAKEIILFDLKTRMEESITYPEKFCLALKKVKGYAFDEVHKIDKKLYFMPFLIPQILMLDMETLVFETWDVEAPIEECAKAFGNHFCNTKGTQIYESKIFAANNFCEILGWVDFRAANKTQGSIGKAIYQSL